LTFKETPNRFRPRSDGVKLIAMNRMLPALGVPVLAVLMLALPAAAQSSHYPVTTTDFDTWCTEIQRLDWQRCDRRQPDDVAKYESWRHTFERVEIQYLRDKEYVIHFDETFLHNDPVDKRPDSTIAQPPSPVAGN
jgi:hypothetical protein